MIFCRCEFIRTTEIALPFTLAMSPLHVDFLITFVLKSPPLLGRIGWGDN